jgi:pre-mRNA-splicing factor ATP-dependent RNA helicase DHX15/PRP43
MQADNVREQLKWMMERFEVELVSLQDQKKMFLTIRQALCCGFFMEVAHKEGEKGNYTTAKDIQVRLVWVGECLGADRIC